MLTLSYLTLVVGSWLSVRRDRANKRRDLRVQYLIEAYSRLSTATERRETDPAHFASLDSAIVDVQLFGTSDQIAAAQTFVKHLAEHRTAQLVELLSSLRNDLRKELRLEHVEGPMWFSVPASTTKERSNSYHHV
jgi:hypothetical protein